MEFSTTASYRSWLNNMMSGLENIRWGNGTINFQGHTYDAFSNLVAFDKYGGEVFYVDGVDKNDELVVDKKSIDDFLGEFRVVE